MTVEQLREFVILAEERNYLVAADMLFSTQATLSRHIMAMEKELGFLLFNRSTKKIELTQEGSRFLLYARRAVKLGDACRTEIRQLIRGQQESLLIGYSAMVTFYRCMELLKSFTAEHPEVSVELVERDSDTLVENMREDRLDIAFIQENPFEPPTGLDKLSFHSDTMLAVLPESHPLALEREIELSQLKDESFITSVEGREPATVFMEACRRAGFEPKVAHTGIVGRALFQWVRKGGCVALEWKEPALTHSEGGVALVEVRPRVEAVTSILYRSDRLSRVGRQLLEYYRKHSLEMNGVKP